MIMEVGGAWQGYASKLWPSPSISASQKKEETQYYSKSKRNSEIKKKRLLSIIAI